MENQRQDWAATLNGTSNDLGQKEISQKLERGNSSESLGNLGMWSGTVWTKEEDNKNIESSLQRQLRFKTKVPKNTKWPGGLLQSIAYKKHNINTTWCAVFTYFYLFMFTYI